MTLAAFLAGCLVGALALLYVIGRSMSTPEARPKPPQDVYLDDLAEILRREAW
jgi:hypothetical protein